jgi:surfactin synthase thioesterase subunit
MSSSEIARYLTSIGAMSVDERSAELLALTEPAIRADFQALEAREPGDSGEPIRAPITVFRAQSDKILSGGSSRAWASCTRGDLTYRIVPGGHFVLDTSLDHLLRGMAEDLDSDLH